VLLRHLFGLLPHAVRHWSLLLLVGVGGGAAVGGRVAGAASLAPVHRDELRAVGGLAGVFEVEVRAELDDVVQLPASEEARQADEVLVAGQVVDGDGLAFVALHELMRPH
jgi:hypothetical protein